MSVLQTFPKPRTVLCKREQLMRWTGWKEKYIAYLVKEGRLKTWQLRERSKPLYFVESAQEILDGNGFRNGIH